MTTRLSKSISMNWLPPLSLSDRRQQRARAQFTQCLWGSNAIDRKWLMSFPVLWPKGDERPTSGLRRPAARLLAHDFGLCG